MNNILNDESLFKNKVNKMFESSLRRKNRRSTIIANVLGWILQQDIHSACLKRLKTFNSIQKYIYLLNGRLDNNNNLL